jgi:hypothetical protein
MAYHSFGGEVGGFEHSHDTPPYPFMPSPTFAHSSVIYPVGLIVMVMMENNEVGISVETT